jgi:hypothetical protein
MCRTQPLHPQPNTHGPAPTTCVHMTQYSQGTAVRQVDGVPAGQNMAPGEQLLAGLRSWGLNQVMEVEQWPWAGGAVGTQ